VIKPTALCVIAAVLVLSPSCVKQPDWIESTLVTVDVTGVRQGAGFGSGNTSVGSVVLDLEQAGPKVTGRLAYGFWASGPLEGRVGGDVFRFRTVGRTGEITIGELTVSGDEREGSMTAPVGRA